jgi:hypothetical protein
VVLYATKCGKFEIILLRLHDGQQRRLASTALARVQRDSPLAHSRVARLFVLPSGAEFLAEIIAKLATVLEVETAELLRVPMPKGNRESCRYRSN